MAEFVLFDPDIHLDNYHQLLEHRTNTAERMKKEHKIDVFEIIGLSIPDLVRNELETHVSLKPRAHLLVLPAFRARGD